MLKSTVNLNYPLKINFEIELKEGEIIVFKGPNASGKTTTVKSIIKLIDGAKTYVDNIEILTPQEGFKRGIYYVPQHHFPIPIKTSIFLNKLGISSTDDRYLFHNWSGGERKLFDFNLGLKLGKYLILDEVDANLDVKNKEKIASLIKENEKSYLIISHDENFIEKLNPDKIYIFKREENKVLIDKI